MGILPPDPRLARGTINGAVWAFLKGGPEAGDFPLLKAMNGVPVKLDKWGVEALLLITPKGAELMDLDSDAKGTADLHRFFEAAEGHYNALIVWRPRAFVERYLMNRREGWEEHMDWRMGEKCHGLRWVRPA